MTLYEGRNRQIRKMCEQAGLRVRHLKRIAIGKLTLGRLRRGEWRYLTSEQVSYLKGVTNNV
jgi:23S rRNA pseudouridine2605 synthase